jgi:hypothetical protein
MRRTIAVLGFTAVLASAVASIALMPEDTRADTAVRNATFLVPTNDGYGVADCLISGSSCGQIIANTWCEAQGYDHAVSFRITAPDEVTGAVQTASLTQRDQPIEITCAN